MPPRIIRAKRFPRSLRSSSSRQRPIRPVEMFIPLLQQAGGLEPNIDDCQAMVDSARIEPAYDRQLFNVAVTDIPARKTDFVAGRYELPAPRKETTGGCEEH